MQPQISCPKLLRYELNEGTTPGTQAGTISTERVVEREDSDGAFGAEVNFPAEALGRER